MGEADKDSPVQNDNKHFLEQMDITARIAEVKYRPVLAGSLPVVDMASFDINTAPTSCLLHDGNYSFAVSKWVSPKRTRSYPYERVYNTFCATKRITIIPVVKDEGADGDRDFIQWDTIALMSLLDVYVIFAYYNKADRVDGRENKITNQQFDNAYIIRKIKELEAYQSSALHWNTNELKNNLSAIVEVVKTSYLSIGDATGVKLHGEKGLDEFQQKINKSMQSFMEFSREKARQAQAREIVTYQPKEHVATLTKAKITITNYLGGEYNFTVDEVEYTDSVVLIESKHSATSMLPSQSDIKDGLLKMMLYCNIPEATVDGKTMPCKAVLKLTSTKVKGKITSSSIQVDVDAFYSENQLSSTQQTMLSDLFAEARDNKFTVIVQGV